MGTYSLLNIIWFVTLIKCCGSFLVKKIYIYSTLLFIFQGAAYYSSTYPFHQEYLSTSAFSRPFLEFYLVLFWRFSFIIVFVLEKKKEEKIWKKKRKSKRKRKTRRRRKWGRNSRKSVTWSAVPDAPKLVYMGMRLWEGQRPRRGRWPMIPHRTIFSGLRSWFGGLRGLILALKGLI